MAQPTRYQSNHQPAGGGDAVTADGMTRTGAGLGASRGKATGRLFRKTAMASHNTVSTPKHYTPPPRQLLDG